MSQTAEIKIDAVKAAEQDGHVLTDDVLEIEWFEINKQRIRRKSLQGAFLQLDKNKQQQWRQGDSLWSEGKCIATIRIKPCLTILLHTEDLKIQADFCYYIGNRHLPIYRLLESNGLAVPYDGNLFEQLKAKFQNYITLQEMQLLDVNRLGSREIDG